ncbi:hypothetical protein DKP76_04660 [Falsochrobactrum shanghaiense]|uniref:Diguanylate cyclase DosC n=1 Tax=Falsochrobactrum shanghaiense TaxID=2201899 RepID=A0A316JCI9_9HYPH|nr:GGDEF domain-containing protein [Falsochrobactrum shanghaiense]PWL18395.1 hypothetical protein DKP76_04660 [Falsochrobactrum shanghaiense]
MQETALAYYLHLDDGERKSHLSRLSGVIEAHAEEYVKLFYANFLKDKQASVFLSQSIVHQRLSRSLHQWLLDMLKITPGEGVAEFAERQKMIGAIHARIKIPVHLVLEGASLLKTEIAKALMHENADEAAAPITLVNELIDYAMLHMSKAYVKDVAERVQIDEAYRLFSLGQDVGLERETQKSALMEWSQNVLFQILGNPGTLELEPLSNSPFGLWVRHRGAVMFEDSVMLSHIQRTISEIDENLLPRFIGNIDRSAAVARLHVLIDELKYLLNDLFQSLAAASNARDPLTLTLTRRFLPSILGREVTMANERKTPLTLLMIDVDHFKKINDNWGHSAGDHVLRQMAETIIASTRASDYVVRYGGEEFLVILVETNESDGYGIAERIRADFEAREFRVADGTSIRVTISIGIACHDGHPDFQRLIDSADGALYNAKSAGRNRIGAVQG